MVMPDTAEQILADIVKDDDPFYDDPDEGTFCRYCLAQHKRYKRAEHDPSCVWVRAIALRDRHV